MRTASPSCILAYGVMRRTTCFLNSFQNTSKLGTTKMSYALVEEDGGIVGILSQADYASALELRPSIRWLTADPDTDDEE